LGRLAENSTVEPVLWFCAGSCSLVFSLEGISAGTFLFLVATVMTWRFSGQVMTVTTGGWWGGLGKKT